ncbi:zinc dependent phospholipase C family protein [Paenibacillus silvisoli]|uniref:zinc dependent phospholipase C family protein n=1 Tax=Paenibacillus silvisoli TaxID=3110539 RepID=UPI002B1BE531|nr:zinc dependent phospholipase C family protein [Paenibacillus silvisoli]
MPLPLVHLTISEHMFRRKGEEANTAFLLGSISPDAIHMRENTTREHKLKTHFDIKDSNSVEELFQKMRSFIHDAGDGSERMFALGYASHVLTDFLWTHSLYETFTREASDAQHEDLRSLYYAETDQIDYILYRDEPWRAQVWVDLKQCAPCHAPGLLSADEVERWKLRVIGWHDQLEQAPTYEPKYFTEMRVRAFIEETAERLSRLL